MRRGALADLKSWHQSNKRKPLILRGARQVGKSTLVRIFAKENEIPFIEINLEKTKLKSFESEEIDVKKIILEIELKTNQSLTPETLLFLDEIQEYPKAIQALRYFYEERPSLAVIAAGSLLEFTLNDHDFSMPVGRVEYYHLAPFTFGEYLSAIGKSKLVDELVANPFKTTEIFFEELSHHLREFYFIGGMPEAIQTYIDEKSFLSVEKVHRSIMETYIDDFSKYATRAESIHLGKLIRTLPHFIGKKIKYSELLPDTKHASIKSAVRLLEQAKIITQCTHTNASGIPLYSLADESVFKVYFLDIGLLNHLLGLKAEEIITTSDEKLLTEGMQAEQFIAQHLPKPLYYWLKDKKNNSAEIDFIIQKSRQIIPIEVKSGKSGSLKSLHHFMSDKKLKNAVRFDLKKREESSVIEKIDTVVFDGVSKKNCEYTLKNFPLFIVEWLEKNL